VQGCQALGERLVVVEAAGEELGRERPPAPVAEQAVDELGRAPLAVARVAELRQRTRPALEVGGGDVVEGVLPRTQVAAGKAALDRILPLAEPVERSIEVVLVYPLDPKLGSERRVRERAGGGELGCRVQDARDEHGQAEGALARGGAIEQAGELEPPGHLERRLDVAVQQARLDLEGLIDGEEALATE